MKNTTAAALFAVSAVYFAIFAVFTYESAVEMASLICGVMLECPEPSFVSVYLMAFLSAVSAVFSVVSLKK
jgi:hypothetical protein